MDALSEVRVTTSVVQTHLLVGQVECDAEKA